MSESELRKQRHVMVLAAALAALGTSVGIDVQAALAADVQPQIGSKQMKEVIQQKDRAIQQKLPAVQQKDVPVRPGVRPIDPPR